MDLLPLLVEAAAAVPADAASSPYLTAAPAAVAVPMETTGYPNWDAPPAPPPGLDTYAEMWIGWGYWVAGLVAFFGLVAAGVMMMIGKLGSRSAVSADGLRHGVAVIFGVCLVIMATSILTGLFAV